MFGSLDSLGSGNQSNGLLSLLLGGGQSNGSGLLGNMGLPLMGGMTGSGSGPLSNGGFSGFGITGSLPGGLEHSNQALQYPGEGIGALIGSIWGMPGLGATAGKNAGLTAGDLFGGNWKGLGWDMSANLPPGMQATGTGGILNTATGLPLAQLFGL